MRYIVKEEIGRGAMGIVYRAHDTTMGRDVAFKVLNLPPGLSGSERDELIKRFQKEAQAAGRLSTNANIVASYDVGEQDGMHFIAMELVEGTTLSALLEQGSLPFPQVLDIMLQVCEAMEFAHSWGIIHRDLKPDNIFVLQDGWVKVGDFGIAKILNSTVLTQSGGMLGTPGYMSPEQIRGKPATEATDIFAAGVLLFEMLTGVNPFEYGLEEPSYAAVIHRVAYEEQPHLADIDPEIPAEFEATVSRALAKDPGLRQTGFKELSNELAAIAAKWPEYEYHRRVRAVDPGLLVRTSSATTGKPEPTRPELDDVAATDGALLEASDETAGSALDNHEAVPEPTPLEASGSKDINEGDSYSPEPPEDHDSEGATDNGGERGLPGPNLLSRLRLTPTIAIAIGVLIVVGITLGLVFGLATGEERVSTPDTVGLTQEQAKIKIDKAGLEFAAEYSPSNDRESGEVLDQEPGEGESVKKGSLVTVLISAKGKVDLPDLVGQDRVSAEGILRGLFLNLDVQSQSVSDQAQDGKVLSQNPGASRIDAGATVSLVVGSYCPTAHTSPSSPSPTSPEAAQPSIQEGHWAACTTCGGSGYVAEFVVEGIRCANCGGTGEMIAGAHCPMCNGTGYMAEERQISRQCPTCNGQGQLWIAQ